MCWGVRGGRGLGAQTPSLVPAEISAPMSPGHSAQGPQRACLSYQPHSHHLLQQQLACLVCLCRPPPATDTMGFGAVRRDLGGHGKPPGGQQGAGVLPSLCWGWHQAPLASQHCMDPPPPLSRPRPGGRGGEPGSCSESCRAASRSPELLRDVLSRLGEDNGLSRAGWRSQKDVCERQRPARSCSAPTTLCPRFQSGPITTHKAVGSWRASHLSRRRWSLFVRSWTSKGPGQESMPRPLGGGFPHKHVEPPSLLPQYLLDLSLLPNSFYHF